MAGNDQFAFIRLDALSRSQRVARALALLGLILAGLQFGAGGAWAGSKDKNQKNSRNGWGYNSGYYYEAFRKQQAEMERQRKAEAERQAKEQARVQQQQQQKQQQQQQRQQQTQQQANSSDKSKSQQQQANNQNAKRPDSDSRPDDDAAALDDDIDPTLTDAERNVRAIARMRQHELERVQRDLAVQAHKEQERAARIQQRMIRKRERDLAKTLKAPPQAPPRILPVVAQPAASQGGPGNDGAVRPPKLLDSLQGQASHLGMGRNALKPDAERPERVRDRSAEGGADGKGAGERLGQAGDARSVARAAGRIRAFPGQDRGAEMPSKMFVDERKSELVISDISPVDLETAKALGFVIGDAIDLKGTGTRVRRLTAPGVSRDEAERELHKALPFLPVMPNHAYTIFMGTLGETEGASALPGLDPRKVSPASAKPCPSQTCFGSQLIKWTNSLGACTKDVRIGVIDTSFDIAHPAFNSLKSIQGEFLGGERPSPYDWHGTAVLSLLAGNPKSSTPGLVPDATFLLASAFRSDVNGNASTDTVRLLAALDWLDQLDVDIVNMSFSGPQDNALAAAIERMSKKGVIFIAAAGNMGPTAAPSYPAAYPHVIAVTAVNRNGMNYKSANRGSYIDMSAPGVDILTALPDAKQGYRTGTSFAVPFVTAILATKAGSGHPASEFDLLAQVPTRDLGPPGPDPIYGAGLAMAPQQCTRGGDTVADGTPSALDAWATQTTFIKAGAGFAP